MTVGLKGFIHEESKFTQYKQEEGRILLRLCHSLISISVAVYLDPWLN